MNENIIPFNIDLLILTPENTKLLRPVTVLDIFDGATKNFHNDGLFSTAIFGRYGEEVRNRTFSYIDLKIDIFHPVIFKALCDLKELYHEIMAGKGYAIWDDKLKDFERSTPLDGETGFSFFMKHFKEIKFEKRPSTKREYNIKLIEKFKDKCLISKIVVLPAGLRDFEIDDTGKPSKDEVNTFYIKALAYSNLITPASIKINPESIDTTRYNLQANIVDLFNYIKNLLEGKKKLILDKWASRKIFNGTRNVITSLNNDTTSLGSKRTVGYNQTVIGLYQYLKASLPISMYKIKTGFISNVFIGPTAPAMLVNKKTLKKEQVEINSDYFDDWMSDEGLEKTITSFSEETDRHAYITIGNHYLGLIYKGPDMTYKLFQDIDDLPSTLSKEYVTPITYAELFYLSVFDGSEKNPLLVTRYPITGFGSIYPSFSCVKSTVESETRTMLDDNWVETGTVAISFPIKDVQFVNSISPHASHLSKLGAD